MGTRPSVHAIYGKDERGIHTRIDTVYAGPTYSQKQAGYTPKPVKAEKPKESKPKKQETKSKVKSKGKSKRR